MSIPLSGDRIVTAEALRLYLGNSGTEPQQEPGGDGQQQQQRRLFFRPYELAQTRREWLIRRLFARGEMGLLFGGWGTYKSFLALHLAQAIVDGDKFLGMPARQGTVAYMAGEGSGGIANRLRAAFGVARMADRSDAMHERLWIASEIPPLTKKAGFERVVAELESMPAQPDLLIVDTWFRACGAAGVDPNSPADAAQLVHALDSLRQRFPGLSELALHHTPNDRDDRASGWLGLPAAVDVQLSAKAVGHAADLTCEVTLRKVKDGESGQSMLVHLAKSFVDEDEDGPVSSLRVDSYEWKARDVTEPPAEPKVRDLLIGMLGGAGDTGVSAEEARQRTGKVPSTISSHFGRLVRDGIADPFVDPMGRKRWRQRPTGAP